LPPDCEARLDAAGGFRTRYSMNFLTQNLCFILMRRGSL
jgi:hypothetical protein